MRQLRVKLPASIEMRFRYNQDFASVNAMIPGTLAMLLALIPAILMALAVVREKELGSISDDERYRVRAHAAAVDNVALFFGEDVFIAIGSILLIKGFLQQSGVVVQPFDLSIWAIPTAVLALIVHGTRVLLLDRKLKREAAQAAE